MNPLIPYIDSKNLTSNGSCYTFYNDDILVYFEDTSVQKYKVINDKIYLSNDDFTVPTAPGGGDSEPCTPVECNNLFDMSSVNGLTATAISYTYNSETDFLSTSGTYNQWTQPESVKTNVVLEQGKTYYLTLNHSLNYRLYLYKGSVSGTYEWFNVGQTTLSFTSNVNGPLFIQFNGAETDVRIMITTDIDNQTYCRYDSSTVCPETPDVSESSFACYSYDDITHIPHSLSGLSPFYCFLCVVIFLTLLYVPYKIFIRPFFRKP